MTDDPKPEEPQRTVFMPSGSVPPASPPPPPAEPPAAAPAGVPEITIAPFQPIRPETYGRVAVGAVLNDIFQVTRFIARGGMGEVFEGVNVNSDERVAIKVILPALAADPNVQAMFRKEAKTLTRLSHPALVQYRVLAQEPRLNVLYIVTDFIEGEPLADVLGKLHPSPAELRSLLRCLCEGLKAAHALGAIHRDLAPDNVLLVDDRLDRAKIIDFGIAKDLDASKGTIVGDGFAGKLGYVAPEQFGDFGREIGPWTDVYSLALVMLALILGRNVDMGATLVEAVDRRRAGVDLSAVPDDLRPVLAGMLQADPAKRFRSMDDVLRALDGGGGAERTVFAPGPAMPLPPEPPPAVVAKAARSRTPLLLGGAAVGVLAIGLAVFALLPKSRPAAPPAATAAVGPTATASGAPKAELARRSVESALPYLGCTWLDLESVTEGAGGLAMKLAGVAGSPAGAEAAVSKAAAGSGAPVANVDLEAVAPVESPVCPALDAFRLIRAQTSDTGRRLATAQPVYRIMSQSTGKMAARAVITMDIGSPTVDFALFGLEPTGKIDAIIPDRATAQKLVGSALESLGPDRYRLPLDTDHQGWSGLLLLTGKGPFDPALIAAAPAARGASWPERFKAAADAGGWKAEMVWYKTTS